MPVYPTTDSARPLWWEPLTEVLINGVLYLAGGSMAFLIILWFLFPLIAASLAIYAKENW